MDIMTRTFFPVGNGGFCLEHFESGENVIYDCGATKKSLIDSRVNDLSSYIHDEKIDYVFISHLHADHVNGLPELLQQFTVKKLVLPYLYPEDRFLLLLGEQARSGNINSDSGPGNSSFIEELIHDPEGTIHGYNAKTKIAYIRPTQDVPPQILDNSIANANREINDDVAAIPANSILNSGHVFEIGTSDFWQYIPCNQSCKSNKDQLIEKLHSAGFYSVNDIKAHIQTNSFKKIADIYKSLNNNLNLSSLCLLSIASDPSIYQEIKTLDQKAPCRFSCPVSPPCVRFPQRFKNACLYLGDYEAKDSNNWDELLECLKKAAGFNFPDDLGILQVPHHGSHRNFRDEFIDDSFLAFINANPTRDHPSNKVLWKYLQRGKAPYLVSQDYSSQLQTINKK